MAKYVYSCLDRFHSVSAPAAVWKHLEGTMDCDEETLDRLTGESFEAAKAALKTLKKRWSSGWNSLQHLIAVVAPSDQEKMLTTLNAKADRGQPLHIRLLHYHCTCWNEYRQALSEEAVYRRFFGEEKRVEGKLAKHRSATLKRLRRFIAIEMADKQMSDLQELVWLQKFFQERSGTVLYEHIRAQVIRKKSERHEWSSHDYYTYFYSDAVEYDFQSDRNGKTNDLNLWNTIQSLDEYYLIERLWYSCHLLNQNQVAPLALPPLSQWLHIDIKSPRFKWFFDKPLGKIFTLALDLLVDDTGKDNLKLKHFLKCLRESESSFSITIINSFEIFAANYAVRCINRGDFSYGQLLFEIYENRIHSKRIYADGKILSGEYHTITILALRLKKFDWAKDFIEKNKRKIIGVMPSMQHYEFCLAQYLYAVNELFPSLQILMNSDFKDIDCKMVARILELKVLYELDAAGATRLRVAEQLDERIEAAILFFFRLKNVPPAKKLMGKRFADFMKKILRAAGNRRLKLLEKIRSQVETIDYIAERQWLLRILDELIEKLKKGGRR